MSDPIYKNREVMAGYARLRELLPRLPSRPYSALTGDDKRRMDDFQALLDEQRALVRRLKAEANKAG